MKALFAAALSVGLIAGVSHAGTILDTTEEGLNSGTISLGNFLSSDRDPIGQTFILTQPTENIVAGGFLVDVNASFAPAFNVTISLLSGAGFSGEELGSVNVTFDDGFDALHTESFAALGVLDAGTYTLGFASNGFTRGAVRTTTKPVSDTQTFNENGVFVFPNFGPTALSVLVTGDEVAAVPVPATLPLMLGGLLLVGGALRRRKA